MRKRRPINPSSLWSSPSFWVKRGVSTVVQIVTSGPRLLLRRVRLKKPGKRLQRKQLPLRNHPRKKSKVKAKSPSNWRARKTRAKTNLLNPINSLIRVKRTNLLTTMMTSKTISWSQLTKASRCPAQISNQWVNHFQFMGNLLFRVITKSKERETWPSWSLQMICIWRKAMVTIFRLILLHWSSSIMLKMLSQLSNNFNNNCIYLNL